MFLYFGMARLWRAFISSIYPLRALRRPGRVRMRGTVAFLLLHFLHLLPLCTLSLHFLSALPLCAPSLGFFLYRVSASTWHCVGVGSHLKATRFGAMERNGVFFRSVFRTCFWIVFFDFFPDFGPLLEPFQLHFSSILGSFLHHFFRHLSGIVFSHFLWFLGPLQS